MATGAPLYLAMWFAEQNLTSPLRHGTYLECERNPRSRYLPQTLVQLRDGCVRVSASARHTAVVRVRVMLFPVELLTSPAKEDLVAKKRVILALFFGLVVATAALVWATESAPSNTVGFFCFDLSGQTR